MIDQLNPERGGRSSSEAGSSGSSGIGLAVASLVLGIISVPLSPFLIGGICGLIGSMLAIVHLRRKTNILRPLAWWGLTISVIGLLAAVGFGAYYYIQIKQFQKTTAVMEQQDPKEWAGLEAPDFTLKYLNGSTFTLSELRGHRVILDFWATWCPPCRREIPHLVRLRNTYDSNDLVIIGISPEDEETLSSFATEQRINYSLAREKDLPAPYADVISIPTTFFIDRQGIIRHVAKGYHDFEELKDLTIALDDKKDPND
jgi:peroxiredoxin